MKPLAFALLSITLLFGADSASAQRAGAMGGFRSGGAVGRAGIVGAPGIRGGFSAFSRTAPVAARFRFFPGAFPFHNFRHSVGFPFHRQGWFFGGYPGAIFVGSPYPYSPYYYYGSSVWTAPYAPYVDGAYPYANETAPAPSGTRTAGQWAPYDPTPQEVVERMLALADVRKGDVVYDLGAGDGRIVIAAAKKYGVRAVGLEIDPGLVKLARENVSRQGVEKLVEIRHQDFMTADLSPASVVTLYLSHDGNFALRSKLLNQLKSGARVVSYTFDMGDWQPRVAESYRDSTGDRHMIYLWQIGDPQVFSEKKSTAANE